MGFCKSWNKKHSNRASLYRTFLWLAWLGSLGDKNRHPLFTTRSDPRYAVLPQKVIIALWQMKSNTRPFVFSCSFVRQTRQVSVRESESEWEREKSREYTACLSSILRCAIFLATIHYMTFNGSETPFSGVYSNGTPSFASALSTLPSTVVSQCQATFLPSFRACSLTSEIGLWQRQN